MTKESNPRSFSVRDLPRSTLAYDSIEHAFPVAPAGVKPFGARVLVQIRTPMTRTKTGIHLPEETRETELWNTQVAKVIELGPGAFKDRDTLKPWPEGAWCSIGDFVRCPKYGGDRWEVPVPNSPDAALFVLFKDTDISGLIEGDPLAHVAYLR